MGPDKHDTHEIRILNRIVSWSSDCIRVEADQRHGETMLKALGVDHENCKGETSPKLDPKHVEADDGEPLPPSHATLYRACAARANFWSCTDLISNILLKKLVGACRSQLEEI